MPTLHCTSSPGQNLQSPDCAFEPTVLQSPKRIFHINFAVAVHVIIHRIVIRIRSHDDTERVGKRAVRIESAGYYILTLLFISGRYGKFIAVESRKAQERTAVKRSDNIEMKYYYSSGTGNVISRISEYRHTDSARLGQIHGSFIIPIIENAAVERRFACGKHDLIVFDIQIYAVKFCFFADNYRYGQHGTLFRHDFRCPPRFTGRCVRSPGGVTSRYIAGQIHREISALRIRIQEERKRFRIRNPARSRSPGTAHFRDQSGFESSRSRSVQTGDSAV